MATAALDDEGLALKEAMQHRIGILASAASVSGVRLMIDAEQSWLQPAAGNTIYSLQVYVLLPMPCSDEMVELVSWVGKPIIYLIILLSS